MLLWLVVVAAVLPVLLLKGFRRWVSSMSGAVWILVVVTVMSLAGILIGQNLPVESYTERYGAGVGQFIVRTGLTDVFGSWYFLFLVSLLTVSLVACSAGRLRRLASVGGRRRAARIGSFVTHVSLVIILAAGLVTGLAGFRYVAPGYLAAGDTMEVPEGGFSVRVDAATTEFNEDGAVSEYYSDVVVIENGEEIASHRIQVNDPLVHNGIGLYQHQMLPSPTSVKELLVGFVQRTPEGELPVRHVAVPFKEEFDVPGSRVSLKVLEFLSDFTYDIEQRTAELASIGHGNPAVLVQISESGRVVGDMWLFADLPAHQNDEGMPCRLFLLDYVPDFELGLTRFEISRQPGTPLLFIGFVVMSLGLALTFWTRPIPGDDDQESGGHA